VEEWRHDADLSHVPPLGGDAGVPGGSRTAGSWCIIAPEVAAAEGIRLRDVRAEDVVGAGAGHMRRYQAVPGAGSAGVLMTESPYLFTKSEGNVHIRMASRPTSCVACVRADAFEIVWQESRKAAIAEVMALVGKGALGGKDA
jgi:hypothetical protein